MKKLIFIILLLPFLYAACDSGKIDINSASLEELDGLYGVGPVYAQNIIDARPYEILDDLVNANGIGTVTLENIKSQGLACVAGEKTFIDDNDEDLVDNVEEEEKEEKIKEIKEEPPEPETIHLNPKTIKTENSNEQVEKKDYSKYLIFMFCIILAGLYLINAKNEKRKKEKRKTEWR